MNDYKDLFKLDACLTLIRYAISLGVDEATGTVPLTEDPDTIWEVRVRCIQSPSTKESGDEKGKSNKD